MRTGLKARLQRLSWAEWGILLILVLGIALRLVDASDAPLDFHPTRQLHNLLVARSIYYQLLPPSDAERQELAIGFRNAVGQYEPPIIESLVALTWYLIGQENFVIPRLWETFFWALGGMALAGIVRRFLSEWAALASLAYFMVLPFAVQASRSFQPDPLMTSLFVIGVYFLFRWAEDPRYRRAILAGAVLGLATLVKIVIAFLVAGIAIALVWTMYGRRFWKVPQVWLLAFLMIAPSFAYYILAHAGRASEYFSVWTLDLLFLVTQTKFYARWLSFIGNLFGLTVFFLSLAGTILAPARLRIGLIGLWVGYFLYGLTLPFQAYTHSYYHLQLVPVISLGLAPLFDLLTACLASQPLRWRLAFLALAAFVVGYHAYVARSILVAEDFRAEARAWQKIGAALPKGKIIALTQDYGYRLMYWGWRKAELWPYETELSQLRGNKSPAESFAERVAGKDYFLVTAFGELERQPQLKQLLSRYPVLAQGDGFVLYDLRHPVSP
jgi:hypothetical protein